MSEVTVTMPVQLTPEMIRAVRDHQTTSRENWEDWHTHLGWLLCAWDVLVEMRLTPSAPWRPIETAQQAAHSGILRALDEAGVRDEVLRGMCIEVGIDAFNSSLRATSAPDSQA